MIFEELPKRHSCSIHPGQGTTYLFDFLFIEVELSGLLVFSQLVDDFSVVSFIQIVISICAYCTNAVYQQQMVPLTLVMEIARIHPNQRR